MKTKVILLWHKMHVCDFPEALTSSISFRVKEERTKEKKRGKGKELEDAGERENKN